WGIIGPGSIAQDFIDDLKLVKGGEHIVTSLLGHTKETAEDFAGKFSIPSIYYTIEEFIRHRDFDAVYIATPHTLHYEQSLACLEAGIPVLCEKPATINTEQLQHLISTAQSKKTFFLEGMWVRFLPSIKQLLDIVASGQIGEVISVQADMSYKAPKDQNNRYFNPDLGGGSLLDLGVYPIFLASLLLGRPHRLCAGGRLSEKGIDEACAILFTYSSGQYALLESSLVTQTKMEATVFGSKGIAKILSPWNEKPEGIEVSIYNGDSTIIPCEWEGRGFQFEVEEMQHCIANGQIFSPLLDHQFSLDMMKTVDKIKDQIHVKYDKYE
ncbi:MAG: Gfo/Idh/MocA family oxidoreductase, partial [Bacteroidetes bacterium]|nr:Gfo/Idh/MocA family oxidoreductase [Bacteroidota bacterium]